MGSHRKYSASAAHRFVVCTASHALEATIPNTTSKYAAEGTRAHAMAAYLLAGGTLEPGEKIEYEDGDQNVATVVDAETLESIAPYLDFVRGMIAKGATCLRVEFSADVIPDKLGGTTDAVFLRRDTLHVCDLKYGKGVIVDPDENLQLICYALACLPYYPTAKQVCLNIIQPRARGEAIRSWRCSVNMLRGFGADIKQAIAEIEAGQTIFRRGEHCQFCKALHGCPSYFELIEDSKLKDPAHVLNHLEEIRALCDAVEKDTFTRLASGAAVPGWKLVHKQARVQWSADAFDELAMLEGMTKTTLIGITEAKKMLGKEIEKYTVKQSSGVTMARETDKRPAAVIDGSIFDDLTGED